MPGFNSVGFQSDFLSTTSLVSERNGERFSVSAFQQVVVNDAPAFVFANDFVRLFNSGLIQTNNADAAIDVLGENARITNFRTGVIDANNGEDALATAIRVEGDARIRNFGEISGEFNGVQFAGPESSGRLDNFRSGVISSDSRAVDIQGEDIRVRNFGEIIGTGDQRNGTVYADDGAQDYTIDNFNRAIIDAGEGNQGAGISLSLAEDGNGDVEVDNRGDIIGRGQASAAAGTAGDGIRLEGVRLPEGGFAEGLFEGEIENSGTISSESLVGTTAGFRTVNGVNFQGTLENESRGEISGAQNGVYFGTGDHNGGEFINEGLVSSDSRALNIDGDGLFVENDGTILGTGNQRNGTVYADDTATNYTIINTDDGVIDAGEGNNGAGISLSLAAEGNGEIVVENDGTILGRAAEGEPLAPANPQAGDGIRLEGVRLPEGGFAEALFEGEITNDGTIASGDNVTGSTAGFHAVDGVGFQGTLTNEEDGVISGAANGVYFGNGDHEGGEFINEGLVSSDSRALNIDGIGLTVENEGDILGTASQRNGTVYADGTADDFSVDNSGTIDAGLGNEGSGFGAEIGGAADGANTFELDNSGTIQGRGNAAANLNAAGDGVRIGNVGNTGVAEATITNSGLIDSEGANGTVAGIRVVNGVDFAGTLTNEEGGVISGVQNGVYFGEGDHSEGVVDNFGTISSDSRAFNIDGTGLTLNNEGDILGTASQRNGTVYADGTADDFSVDNSGTIDAGLGNEGSGFGAEIGGAADGANTFELDNSGTIQGRGNAAANLNAAGDGVRIGNVGNTGVAEATITNSGLIDSEGANGTVAGIRVVNGVDFAGTLTNEEGGVISGVQNGVYFGEGDHSEGVVDNFGTISSDSRAFNIDGTGLTLNNEGDILGTASQRNGTVYADGTADDFSVDNSGTIDAGLGNEGSGFGAEIGGAADGANTFELDNSGTIQGRGNAAANLNAAGDGVRIGNVGNTGVAEATITNSGLIDSEGANGTVAGIRVVNGVDFAGTLTNEEGGVISGVQNGVYFGEGDHSEGVVDNFGTISSDSRAFNIDGTGLTLNNEGDILGTASQRNGTVYADGTADDFSVDNSGTIDAGLGNEGSGFGAEIGGAADGANTFELDNSGTIQGRGNAAANLNAAGDGVRIGNVGNTGVAEATITNSGLIDSEGANGTVAGIRVVDGVGFQGELNNEGEITGVQNGVYFGNGDHSGGVVNNEGIISSSSRAFNIDGTGLEVNNNGDIIGLADQRNGTLYADGTAEDFSVDNSGTIDAGEDNLGSGFGAEIIEDTPNFFELNNEGTIQGRGNALAGTNLAGDGVRIGNPGNSGLTTAEITNSGLIASEGANGTVAGLRVVDGVNFQGTLTNLIDGEITGVQNGVYFGNGDHSGGQFINDGVVSSGSRALNIDGIGLNVVNSETGEILGLGDQRNGTVYADATADFYTFINDGVVDAGDGNNGSGVALQTGDVEGDIVTASIINGEEATIQGQGDAESANQIGHGLRIFASEALAGTTTFDGEIVNDGLIAGSEDSDLAAGISIESGVTVLAPIVNSETGIITGSVNAIDASEGGPVIIENEGLIDGNIVLGDGNDEVINDDGGVIDGDVLLGGGNDLFDSEDGEVIGLVDGGVGDDEIILGAGDNTIAGGTDNDTLTGGEGEDTFVFDLSGGDDIITDFEDGLDILDVSALGPDFDVDAAIAGALQQGDDTRVDLQGNGSVLLQDFLAGDLDETDFLA